MNEITDAQIVDRAIDIIHEGGWQRNHFGSELHAVVPHCIVGALRCATVDLMGEPTRDIVWETVANRVTGVAGGRHQAACLVDWNDSIAVSADDVIEKLKLMGEEVRARAGE